MSGNSAVNESHISIHILWLGMLPCGIGKTTKHLVPATQAKEETQALPC